MRLTGKVIVLFTQYMIERTLTIRELRPETFYPIGIEARDALGRLAPKCQVNAWLLEWLSPQVKLALERAANIELDEARNPSVWGAYVLDRLMMTALGGAMSALAIALRESDYRRRRSYRRRRQDRHERFACGHQACRSRARSLVQGASESGLCRLQSQEQETALV